ncbi:MAG: NAD(P)-dependent oxidoreductase, partial [Clostridiales bacterium]
ENPPEADPLALAPAEAALAGAIGAGEGVMRAAECLIVGYGRIGRELAPRLAALGAHVRIANRGNDRLEAAKTAGFAVIEWGDWIQTAATSNYIFNTAPALLFDSSVLQKLNPQTVLIDLASAPGGVDWQTADLLGIQAVQALGLPGKYAPGFAGLVLADVYEQILWDCLAKRGNRDERS